MKTLYKIFIIIPFVLCIKISAQEPVVFHFNFSFERDYNYTNPNKWILTEEVENITITLLSPNKHIKWNRNFTKSELPKDKNGYCLISDTIKTLKSSRKPYGLKVNYSLASGINDSCKMNFNYPDSVKKLALELFFDQALITKESEDTLHKRILKYDVNPNPNLALIVKYLELEQGVFMGPTWFDHWRITRRPLYILYNNSTDTMFKADKGLFTCFFGDLLILDSINQWKPYFFGGICGTITCDDPIKPGQNYDIVEAYPIGDPLKLKGGYYKYSVDYKDSSGSKKTVNTYFTVTYSKPY